MRSGVQCRTVRCLLSSVGSPAISLSFTTPAPNATEQNIKPKAEVEVNGKVTDIQTREGCFTGIETSAHQNYSKERSETPGRVNVNWCLPRGAAGKGIFLNAWCQCAQVQQFILSKTIMSVYQELTTNVFIAALFITV